MIIKILKEMKQVRIKEDYKNYRTLTNIINDYVLTECNKMSCVEITKNQAKFIQDILEYLEVEISNINIILDFELNKKDYGSFKVVSQSDIVLQMLNNRLKALLKLCSK